MKYFLSIGSIQLNSDAYNKIGFYPKYKHNNLSFGFNFDPILNSEGEFLDGDWEDAFDFIDRFYANYYYANHNKNNENYNHHNTYYSNNVSYNYNNLFFVQLVHYNCYI